MLQMSVGNSSTRIHRFRTAHLTSLDGRWQSCPHSAWNPHSGIILEFPFEFFPEPFPCCLSKQPSKNKFKPEINYLLSNLLWENHRLRIFNQDCKRSCSRNIPLTCRRLQVAYKRYLVWMPISNRLLGVSCKITKCRITSNTAIPFNGT